MQQPQMSEKSHLLQRHLGGDKDAFGELLREYWQPVHNYLYRCGLDKPSREDLMQDIFAKIHQNAAQYQPISPLKTWIFTVAANTVRSYFRSEASRGGNSLHVEIEPELTSGMM